LSIVVLSPLTIDKLSRSRELIFAVAWIMYCGNKLRDNGDLNQVSSNVIVVISKVDSTDKDITRLLSRQTLFRFELLRFS